MKQKLITIVITLIAVLSPLLIMPEAYYPNYNILKLIILLSLGLVLLILLLLSYKTLKIDRKDILLLIFLGLVIISTFLSSDIKKSIIGETNRYEGLLMFGIYICIYIGSKKYFKYEDITKFLNIMFYTSIIIGILGILQRHIKCTELYPIFEKGICSTFGNSNFFGSYISIILPIALSIFIIYGSKRSFILSILMFFNMISSGTRSAWVAFVIIGFVGLMYLIKQKNKVYFKRFLIVLFVFILIFIYLFNGLNIISKRKTNTTEIKINQIKKDVQTFQKSGLSKEMGSSRIEIWNLTSELILKKPIYGCGTDNLKLGLVHECTANTIKYFNRTNGVPDKAHNEYLHIAATIGIPALIIYLIFILLILLSSIKLAKNKKTYFIISLSIFSYLIQAFFNISTIGVAPIFWMLLGLSDNKELFEKINNEKI